MPCNEVPDRAEVLTLSGTEFRLARLMEEGSRPVTLLDGDLVRKHLSSGLGFSREHRDPNIKRIGYVASEVTKNRGVATCAPIAPCAATPTSPKARAGLITEFTGIDDPYEAPERPEVRVDTTDIEPQEAIERILAHRGDAGFLGAGQ